MQKSLTAGLETRKKLGKILIVDDDPGARYMLMAQSRRLGHETQEVGLLKEGLAAVRAGAFDVVFLDVQLPDGNGLEAISEIKKAPSNPDVVIITGDGTSKGAEMAMAYGAWDYLIKPIARSDLELQIKRTLNYRKSKQRPEDIEAVFDRKRITGKSPALMSAIHQAAQSASGDASILLTGETGTGKEVFAITIHENSSRRDGPFVVVDCTTLPDHLVESVLFGHVKGAFTSADKSRVGLVKQADGGTLFLDELGELPLSIQSRFLRVIQEKKFRPVGSDKEETSDFRLISATNRDLEKMVAEKGFRRDLLYRLNAVQIEIPPLRERIADINPLTLHYMGHLCDQKGIEPKGIVPEIFQMLESYDWPGNVRELINVLESAINESGSQSAVYPRDLPALIRSTHIKSQLNTGEPAKEPPAPTVIIPPKDTLLPPFKKVMEDAKNATEKGYMRRLMEEANANLEEACRISGLKRSRIYGLLKKHDIRY
jgi:two-component system NtrC family response regulator